MNEKQHTENNEPSSIIEQAKKSINEIKSPFDIDRYQDQFIQSAQNHPKLRDKIEKILKNREQIIFDHIFENNKDEKINDIKRIYKLIKDTYSIKKLQDNLIKFNIKMNEKESKISTALLKKEIKEQRKLIITSIIDEYKIKYNNTLFLDKTYYFFTTKKYMTPEEAISAITKLRKEGYKIPKEQKTSPSSSIIV